MPRSKLAPSVLMACAVTAWAGSATASSVGPYGVQRVTMLEQDVDGRPLTFSDADIFACVMLPGETQAKVYRVPYGYVTDQTSIPRRLASFVIGDTGLMAAYANAAIVHDYLYASGDPKDKAGRVVADRVMRELLERETVSSSVVDLIDATFEAARSVGGLLFDLARFLTGDRSVEKAWVQRLRGAFGAEEEWKRWANPYTLRLIQQEQRQPKPHDAGKPVANLSSCTTFDTPGDASHLLLHACLHHRFASRPADRPLISNAAGRAVGWPGPRMPTPLVDLVKTLDQTAPGTDCSNLSPRPA